MGFRWVKSRQATAVAASAAAAPGWPHDRGWAAWFNSRRLYRPLVDIPPAQYERNWLQGQQP